MPRKRTYAVLIPLLVVIAAAAVWLIWSVLSNADAGEGPAAAGTPPTVPADPPPDPERALVGPLEVALAPGAERAPLLPASEPEAFQPEGPAIWIAGRVSRPPGTPADELALVLALDEARRYRELYDRRGPADRAWEDAQEPHPMLLATAEMQPNGAFRIGVPEGRRQVHLAVAGRYLYSRTTTPVDLPVVAGVELILPAELGGRITGILSAPPEVSAAGFEGVRAQLGPDIGAGFNPMAIQDISVKRRTEADAAGLFEFRAIPWGSSHGLWVGHDELAGHLARGLAPAPGEHLVLDCALTRGARLAGRVVDDRGTPVPEARVEVRFTGVLGDELEDLREMRTDGAGAFELRGVPPGELLLLAHKQGYRAVRQRLEDEVGEGQDLAGLELVLSLGEAIRGRVLFPGGAPAANARVFTSLDLGSLSGLGALDAVRDPGASTRADDEGHFALGGLRESPYRVNARVEISEGDTGVWFAQVDGVRPGDGPIEVVLDRLSGLAGRVVDTAGEPVTAFGVHSTLAGSGITMGIGAERQSQEFEAAEDGTFVIDGLRRGTWEIEVRARGFATSELIEVAVPDEVGDQLFLFVLPPAVAVSGVVLDTGGTPVSGARISREVGLAERIQNQSEGLEIGTYSDVGGVFLLEDLEPGSISLVASKEGFAPSAAVAVQAQAGERVADVVLELRLGGTLTGEVLDGEGAPVPGQMVIAQNMPNYGNQHMLETDSAGRFRIEHLEPGKWQVIAIQNILRGEVGGDSPSGDAGLADFLGGMKLEVVEIFDGETVHVVLGDAPADPVRVEGQVLHAGQPVSEIMVSFVPQDAEGIGALKMVFTDQGGRFETLLDSPGPYLVTAQHVQGPGQQNSVEYREHFEEGVEEHNLVLELPAGRVSGRVLGPDGEPLPGCRVTLQVEGGVEFGSFLGGQYADLSTDAEGHYDIPYLAPGTYTVGAGGPVLGGMFGGSADAGRQLQSGVTVTEGQWIEHLDFELERPGTLTGTVVDAEGAPVQDASIFVRDEAGRLVERFSLISTDGAGHFRYDGLAAGHYTASARLGQRSSLESDPVHVATGGSGEVRITLEAGTILLVSVIDQSGEAVDAVLSVRDADGHELAGMMSMQEVMENFGSGFSSEVQRVGPLPPGSYRVTATAADGRETAKPVNLSGQAERKLKLRLK